MKEPTAGALSLQESTSDKCALTKCNIWSLDDSIRGATMPLPGGVLPVDAGAYQYVLGIFAPAREFFKVTSYYLEEPIVTKVILVFTDLSPRRVKDATKIISEEHADITVIHMSGFCRQSDKFLYEFYAKGDKKSYLEGLLENIGARGFEFEYKVQKIMLDNNF
ncbi:hypothetical protein GF325_17315 [Candidatus Bathyarchaeota archaeon]|nr:hypothetical protein [Candidatus Bathyarchaeota archaeon]